MGSLHSVWCDVSFQNCLLCDVLLVSLTLACAYRCWDESWDLLHGWCGWHGIGGQLFLFDPLRDVVFVYLTTGFGVLPPWRDPRTRTLLEALVMDLRDA